MPPEHRVTIRLDPVLYAQLEACGSQGQPLAAIVRCALVEYLERQPDTPQKAETLATTLAAVAAKLEGLQEQVDALAARLDTVAAGGQPVAADTPTRQRKLTPRQIRALRDKRQRGVPIEALMDEYGISRASVFRYLQSEQRQKQGP